MQKNKQKKNTIEINVHFYLLSGLSFLYRKFERSGLSFLRIILSLYFSQKKLINFPVEKLEAWLSY